MWTRVSQFYLISMRIRKIAHKLDWTIVIELSIGMKNNRTFALTLVIVIFSYILIRAPKSCRYALCGKMLLKLYPCFRILFNKISAFQQNFSLISAILVEKFIFDKISDKFQRNFGWISVIFQYVSWKIQILHWSFSKFSAISLKCSKT